MPHLQAPALPGLRVRDVRPHWGQPRRAGVAEASTKADRIRAYAGRRAEEIRAEGEARAAKYLEQMQEEPELATFLVWLDALQRSLSKNTTLILPWNAAPWHLMQPGTAAQTAAGDIPQPVAVGP